MRIAVLYIATGKYIVFWEEFYSSCERYFLTDAPKDYFLFTDAETIPFQENGNIHRIPHAQLGWPYDTLLRFQVFNQIKEQLESFDYIFFFNANMLFVKPISREEFLPDGIHDDGLLATLHPGYFNQKKELFPYENKQTQSLAYIPAGEGNYYFMGGLNGGKTRPYLDLINTLMMRTQRDLDNNIIAAWHDESHLNRYLIGKNPKILSPAYGYPEGRKLPFQPKIIIRDKNRYGGHAFLRNEKTSLFKKLRLLIKKLKTRI